MEKLNFKIKGKKYVVLNQYDWFNLDTAGYTKIKDSSLKIFFAQYAIKNSLSYRQFIKEAPYPLSIIDSSKEIVKQITSSGNPRWLFNSLLKNPDETWYVKYYEEQDLRLEFEYPFGKISILTEEGLKSQKKWAKINYAKYKNILERIVPYAKEDLLSKKQLSGICFLQKTDTWFSDEMGLGYYEYLCQDCANIFPCMLEDFISLKTGIYEIGGAKIGYSPSRPLLRPFVKITKAKFLKEIKIQNERPNKNLNFVENYDANNYRLRILKKIVRYRINNAWFNFKQTVKEYIVVLILIAILFVGFLAHFSESYTAFSILKKIF